VPHAFEVVARDERGAEATDTVRTEAIPLGTEYSVGLQQLYVTVKSRLGNRVLDLEKEDFTVQDDGERQEIVTFARGDIPFTAVLLIDSSASMRGIKLDSAMAGAEAFVQGMQDLDQAKLLMFSHEVLTTTPFSSVHHVLSTSLSGAGARGGTALNDYLFSALTMLEMQQGRRVVVLLSDGIDSHSVLDMDDVYAAARSSRALIYWLRLPGTAGMTTGSTGRRSMSSAWRDKDEYREHFELLEKAVDESGGRIIEVTSIGRLQREFVEILRELREQYVLAYYPTQDRNNGRWHKVEVKVKRSSTRVRSSEGYVDF
jgi:Ca-activated chloride channel family protein